MNNRLFLKAYKEDTGGSAVHDIYLGILYLWVGFS